LRKACRNQAGRRLSGFAAVVFRFAKHDSGGEIGDLNMRNIICFIAVFALAGCSTVQTPQTVAVSNVAMAELKRSDGSNAGVATLSDRSDGVWLSVAISRNTPGTFGIHIHAVGKCDAPDFASAGPHWNPAQKQHGFDNPMGAHAGDIRNLVVNADGTAAVSVQLAGAVFDSALDADGLALVIHEKADDYSTDPSGNSGKRLICGVFTKG
jgi:Cu-Zn family superoxide dismutase